MSADYALNVFINSATTDPIANPQPSLNSALFTNPQWRKVWNWYWNVSLDGVTWYTPADRVLMIPADAPGIPQPMPPLNPDTPLIIGMFDLNLNSNNQPIALMSRVLVELTVTFSGPVPAQIFNQWPSSANGPDMGPVTMTSSCAGNTWSVVISANPPAPSPTLTVTPPLLNGTQSGASWGIQVIPATTLAGCRADIKVWMELSINGGPVWFYKDPEMQMDQQNK
jgi:hypothetical protein